ncbi:monodehydroascorbate reductase [Carex littledalei]|uniref:Monodehydroascorbate reductase n=1 Tax=Carex littledalei TaxID=544730 RepID=A0A833RTL8_9POAL|nr:monodehydroascorbate reductase [Carex littledalei]
MKTRRSLPLIPQILLIAADLFLSSLNIANDPFERRRENKSWLIHLNGEESREIAEGLERVASSAAWCSRHAVSAIMAPDETSDLDYLLFFYSRVFAGFLPYHGNFMGKMLEKQFILGISLMAGVYTGLKAVS